MSTTCALGIKYKVCAWRQQQQVSTFRRYTTDFYKLIDNLFGKITAQLQMSLLATTRHLLWVPNNNDIIIFINCNWVVTRWEWLFYM